MTSSQTASQTARLGLPVLAAQQAQKHVTHNEALALLDILVQPRARGLAAEPPVEPEEGETWIVGTQPAGAWEGNADALACWTGFDWRFVTPDHGWTVWHEAGNALWAFDGAWRPAQPKDTVLGAVTLDRLDAGGGVLRFASGDTTDATLGNDATGLTLASRAGRPTFRMSNVTGQAMFGEAAIPAYSKDRVTFDHDNARLAVRLTASHASFVLSRVRPGSSWHVQHRFADGAFTLISHDGSTFKTALTVDRTAVRCEVPVALPRIARAALPTGLPAGAMAFVTDAPGGAGPAFFDGSHWHELARGAQL